MPPTVYVLAQERLLSDPLEEYLRSKGCAVVRIKKSHKISADTRYLVVINIDGKFQKDKQLVSKITSVGPKTVVVNSAKNTLGLSIASASLVQIFVDNVVPGFGIIIEELHKKSLSPIVSIPKDAWFAVAGRDELFEKIIALLFSFPENRAFLFGKLYSYREFVTTLNPRAIIKTDLRAACRLPRGDIRIEESNIGLHEIAVPLAVVAPKPSKRRFKPPVIKLPKSILVYMFFALFVIVMFPYILLGASAGMSYVSYKSLIGGNYVSAGKLISVSKSLSQSASVNLSRFSWPLSKTALSLDNVNLVFEKTVGVVSISSELSANMNNRKIVENLSEKLGLELESLYRDMVLYGDDLDYVSSKALGPKLNIENYTDYALVASKVAHKLPELLGYDSAKTYLVLLQNNMELRPTGGFIGSFALITFANGEMVDDTIYDVYSADGQLKGYIEPPMPIVEHLGEASWKMRDSNWDPDFPTSAARAEWFLDKTMDRDVNGVIAINLESVKKYLDVLGPVYLSSFGETINSKNMYEKVQYEVEENFFPGSRKKAQYLSALSEALIIRLNEAVKNMPVRLLEATSKSIDARDIQLYLHDESLAEVLSSVGWDGGVFSGSCEGTCMYVPSGVVEANVGVNKANYFVERRVSTNITVAEKYIEQEVSLTLTNKSQDLDRTPEQRYKVYVRAMAPLESQFLSARVIDKEATNWEEVDTQELSNRKEYGLVMEVLPKEEKTVAFRWRVPYEGDLSRIKLDWWKQSGVRDYPFSASVSVPKAKEFNSTPPFGLTTEGKFGYNTNLSSDFVSEFTWKQ